MQTAGGGDHSRLDGSLIAFLRHLDEMAAHLGGRLPVHAALTITNLMWAAGLGAERNIFLDDTAGSRTVRRKLSMLLSECAADEQGWIRDHAPYLATYDLDECIYSSSFAKKPRTFAESSVGSTCSRDHKSVTKPGSQQRSIGSRFARENLVFKKLSCSAIWSMQSDFYKSKSIDAWISDIPCQISSNKFVSGQILDHVLHRLKLLQRSPDGINPIRALVLEVGGGHGILSLQLARELDMHLRNHALGDKACKSLGFSVQIVCSDMHDGAFRDLLTLPWIQALCEAGHLNFAVMEAKDDSDEQSGEVELLYVPKDASRRLPPLFGSSSSPSWDAVFICANYALDSFPSDLYYRPKQQACDDASSNPNPPWYEIGVLENSSSSSSSSSSNKCCSSRSAPTYAAKPLAISPVPEQVPILSASSRQPVVSSAHSTAATTEALAIPVSLLQLLRQVALVSPSVVELIASDYFISPHDSKWKFALDRDKACKYSKGSDEDDEGEGDKGYINLGVGAREAIPYISPRPDVAALPIMVKAIDTLFREAFFIPKDSNISNLNENVAAAVDNGTFSTFLPTTSFGTTVFRALRQLHTPSLRNPGLANSAKAECIITASSASIGPVGRDPIPLLASLTSLSPLTNTCPMHFCPLGANDFQVLRDFIEHYHSETRSQDSTAFKLNIPFLLYFVEMIGNFDFQLFIDLKPIFLELMASDIRNPIQETANHKRKIEHVYSNSDNSFGIHSLLDVVKMSLACFFRGNAFIAFDRFRHFSPTLDLTHGRVVWLQWILAVMSSQKVVVVKAMQYSTSSPPYVAPIFSSAAISALFLCIPFLSLRIFTEHFGSISRRVYLRFPVRNLRVDFTNGSSSPCGALLDSAIALLASDLEQSVEVFLPMGSPLGIMLLTLQDIKSLCGSDSSSERPQQGVCSNDVSDLDLILLSRSECLLLAHVFHKLGMVVSASCLLDMCARTSGDVAAVAAAGGMRDEKEVTITINRGEVDKIQVHESGIDPLMLQWERTLESRQRQYFMKKLRKLQEKLQR